jgi:hypothetical protein
MENSTPSWEEMQGYVCRCFYERNIYLKSLDLHVTYTGNEADFRSAYAQVKGHFNSKQTVTNVFFTLFTIFVAIFVKYDILTQYLTLLWFAMEHACK